MNEINGWIKEAEKFESPNQSDRPIESDINLIVIHGISLPPGEYGSNNIDKLFLNNLDPNEHKYFNEISDLKVSSHFLIERSGKLKQFVSIKNKAWHAGVSSFEGKKDCNDFSIGIELEGTDSSMYEINQYNKLIDLCKTLMQNYPNINKQKIVGHSDISPGRKTDPGESFDWNFFKSKI
ncbi:MAG: 1,6-anhydro-N-acetylmuramyl-L-alanine amidase AmpD [Gammaproteobacteria bacterium]|tara:strand:- start:26 stop:565 length:540 start_codon:yes stop_codon:yes gene_type:complete